MNAMNLNPDQMNTMERLQRFTPSVFATEPYNKMSEKYAFIPTSAVVGELLKQGFVVAKANESRTRIEAKRGFTKHLLRFRHPDLVPEIGGLVPEIILTNSHDGASSFKISAGVYRLVCLNGMTVGNDLMTVSRRHSGEVGDVIEGVFQVVQDMPKVMETAKEWMGMKMTREQQVAFAKAAMPLRWEADHNGNFPISATQLLETRRMADRSPDLWTTFNVVQEHVIKGGVRAISSNGRRRSSKAVTSVGEDQRLNKSLWLLAEAMAEYL